MPDKAGPPRSTVTVHGTAQRFISVPNVQVFWQGQLVGVVKKHDSINFNIYDAGEVTFISLIRSAKVHVHTGNETVVRLSWSRLWGTLKAEKSEPKTATS
ncbi:MAG: hypothetical protein WKF73_10295 [Nocardioidaceae bacterium]